jgi:hypothetical protein
MQVIGAKISQGESEFQGRIYPYHNVVLYVTEEFDPSKGVGLSSEMVKIPYSRFCALHGLTEVKFEDLECFIGTYWTFGYDKWGKPNNMFALPVPEISEVA